MNEHGNLQVMRRAVQAVASGDTATLAELFAEDVLWRVPGRSALAGDYRGHASVFAFFGALMQQTDGTFRIDTLDMFANDSGGVFIDRLTATRNGRQLDIELLLRVEIAGGRIVRGTDHFHQEHLWDAFWQ